MVCSSILVRKVPVQNNLGIQVNSDLNIKILYSLIKGENYYEKNDEQKRLLTR